MTASEPRTEDTSTMGVPLTAIATSDALKSDPIRCYSLVMNAESWVWVAIACVASFKSKFAG